MGVETHGWAGVSVCALISLLRICEIHQGYNKLTAYFFTRGLDFLPNLQILDSWVLLLVDKSEKDFILRDRKEILMS